RSDAGMSHHCNIGLPQLHIPLCHSRHINASSARFAATPDYYALTLINGQLFCGSVGARPMGGRLSDATVE
ncbi:MAG TPA: hypothetical protein VF663_05410, partial [Telluria sp.]